MNQTDLSNQNLEPWGAEPVTIQTFAFNGAALETRRHALPSTVSTKGFFSAWWTWLSESVLGRWKLALAIVISLIFLGTWFSLRGIRYPATALLMGDSTFSRTSRPPTTALSAATVISILKSPEFAKEAIAGYSGTFAAPDPAAFHFFAEPNGELIRIRCDTPNAEGSVFWANRFADEAASYVQELQARESSAVSARVVNKLGDVEKKLNEVHERLAKFQQSCGVADVDKECARIAEQIPGLNSRITTLEIDLEAARPKVQKLTEELTQNSPELISTREKLNQALIYYTEEHPKVKELRTVLAEIETRLRAKPEGVAYPEKDNAVAANIYLQLLAARLEKENLNAQIESAKTRKSALEQQLAIFSGKRTAYSKINAEYEGLAREQQSLLDSKRNYELAKGGVPLRVLQYAAPAKVGFSSSIKTGVVGASAGAGLGVFAVLLFCGLAKGIDRQIRSEADLHRATRLPILASLGDLENMPPKEKRQWALRTFALLKAHSGRFRGLECGFASSDYREGRSTVVNLLAEAANDQGHRVVVVSGTSLLENKSQPAAAPVDANDIVYQPSKPIMRVSFPGSKWAMERRKEWWDSLDRFASHSDAVVLVDLPPAADAESLFLAANLDRVIWVSQTDLANASETASGLGQMQAAGCNVVGAILNRRPKSRAFRSLVSAAAAGLLILLSLSHQSGFSAELQPTAPDPAAQTNRMSLSASSSAVLAPWQKRLTLGPGDIVTISLYEQAETERPNITIGPDGRLNYLNAQDVVITGLTIDELREKLEQILAKYIRSPRVIVIPQAYRSKQYYLLGNVIETGSYSLDRPVSVVEAIARAKGFLMAARGANSFVAVDFGRSFLVEKSPEAGYQRADIDFEALFTRGDLTQNRSLAPDDYLYFAPSNVQENYVLGEVKSPGPTAFTTESTIIRAITTRGGFTDVAWKGRILVVRGSLNHPAAIVVNSSDILAARAPDFKLEARDIIYVSKKPWSKAEDLLNAAMSDFLRAAIITWSGEHINPLIKEPLF
jgi:protein involved in polysaccharide export with SLBB domain/predicted  nucleic acid-binding Zn-ribbon protein